MTDHLAAVKSQKASNTNLVKLMAIFILIKKVYGKFTSAIWRHIYYLQLLFAVNRFKRMLKRKLSKFGPTMSLRNFRTYRNCIIF